MAPTWPDFASQDGPKTGPKIQKKSRKSVPELIWASTWLLLVPRAAFADPNLGPEPIWDRFWVDLGPMLGRFWFDFWQNFDSIAKASSSIAKLSSATRMHARVSISHLISGMLSPPLSITFTFSTTSILFQVGGMGRQPGKFQGHVLVVRVQNPARSSPRQNQDPCVCRIPRKAPRA